MELQQLRDFAMFLCLPSNDSRFVIQVSMFFVLLSPHFFLKHIFTHLMFNVLYHSGDYIHNSETENSGEHFLGVGAFLPFLIDRRVEHKQKGREWGGYGQR